MCLNLDIFLKIRNDFRSISFWCSQSTRITWCGPAAGVYLYSPQIQTDKRPFLFRLSLARDKPEDNEPGEENSVLVAAYLIVEQTFSTHGHSRRGRNNSMSPFLFNFDLKWLLRTKRTREHRAGRWSGDSKLGWGHLSLNKQDVRARDNDGCSIILRTGAGAEDSQHFNRSCPVTKNVSFSKPNIWRNIFFFLRV